jgi:hypothetical protein
LRRQRQWWSQTNVGRAVVSAARSEETRTRWVHILVYDKPRHAVSYTQCTHVGPQSIGVAGAIRICGTVGALMTQLQIVENPLGSIGHADSVDDGGVTGLSVFDVGGCGSCYTEQGMLFRSDNLCLLTGAMNIF